ncbi:Cation/H(+) antiporter 15 [Glycine soja]|uniref:Cation/H(+) antiporter 15 n=1 Tax=Glycine soja TaxID=3848 RepID=A0A0B2P6G0_GLYSO|nr:Cation/H(+) antiporter 15 [Glycine soja]
MLNKVKCQYHFPNIFTLSSFAVLSETLMERNLVATELGQIALSSAMIREILQWITKELQFNTKFSLQFTIVFLTGATGFAVLLLLIIRPLVNIVVERTPPGKPIKESYIVLLLLGPLVWAAISDTFGIYFIMGTFLYGLVLQIKIDLTAIHEHWKVVLVVLSILFVGCLLKVLACALISPTYNIKPKHGVVLGLILKVKGIVELIFYSRMNKLKVIDTEVFSVTVMYVVVLTSLCIPLIKCLYRHRNAKAYKKTALKQSKTSPKTQFNMVSCVHTDEDVHNMIALIEACNPTTQSPLYVYVVHLIELVGKSTPILLPMNKNNRKSLSVDYPNTNHILRAFENYSNNSSGPVTVHSYVNVAPYRSMHGNHVANTIRNLNTKGTLGILVDRYSVLSWSSSKLSFDVGIFFIGGKDDREALALGIRMLERPNTRVTLFRFVLPTKQDSKFVIYGLKENEEEVLESTLDESLIDEFISKNDISSDIINVVYHEVVVEDCIQVLEAIRGMEKDYADQLGILGDMLASNEFCNGKVPVLVMQCGDEKRVKQLEKVGHNQLFL